MKLAILIAALQIGCAVTSRPAPEPKQQPATEQSKHTIKTILDFFEPRD